MCHAEPEVREDCERLADQCPEIRCPCGRAPGKPDAEEETP